MLNLLYFLLVLGVVVFVHELGHFIFAKLANIYVYEFSLGMGKKLFGYKKKGGETEYCLRLVPIGGFVRLAGEEVDDDTKIGQDRKLYKKSFWQRFLTMIAGATFNFIFAFIMLWFISLVWGSPNTKPIVGTVSDEYPAYAAGLKEGDTIISVNNDKISSWDDLLWVLNQNGEKTATFKIKTSAGITKELEITPVKVTEDKTTRYVFGLQQLDKREYGFASSINYAVNKTGSLFKLMYETITSLFTGGVSVNDLSGPVGIYSVVGESAKAGFANILYLMAFISINVGFINLLPFPAFDGGRVLFLIIEKIKGSPVSPKVENTIHNLGFLLLMALMIYITFNDILKLFR